MNYRWKIKSFDKEKTVKLQKELKINPVLCQLLVQRGFETYDKSKDFLE